MFLFTVVCHAQLKIPVSGSESSPRVTSTSALPEMPLSEVLEEVTVGRVGEQQESLLMQTNLVSIFTVIKGSQ